MYFEYDDDALDYLKSKDKTLGEIIDKIGHINREVDPDLFSSVVHHIIGQQISTKAQATIWQRINESVGVPNADRIIEAGVEKLQSFGMTFRKAEYITDFATKIKNGEFDLDGTKMIVCAGLSNPVFIPRINNQVEIGVVTVV